MPNALCDYSVVCAHSKQCNQISVINKLIDYAASSLGLYGEPGSVIKRWMTLSCSSFFWSVVKPVLERHYFCVWMTVRMNKNNRAEFQGKLCHSQEKQTAFLIFCASCGFKRNIYWMFPKHSKCQLFMESVPCRWPKDDQHIPSLSGDFVKRPRPPPPTHSLQNLRRDGSPMTSAQLIISKSSQTQWQDVQCSKGNRK